LLVKKELTIFYIQFKAEIDAGRPVLLNLAGHSTVGVGYADASSTVSIHDTWDYNTHTMLWGSSYAGMTLQSVSIVNLQASTLTHALDVTKTGTGSGTVTSHPAGINCGSTCSASFSYNTSVTLTAAASAGSTFAGWSGSGCSGTGTCTVTLDAARSVTADFAQVVDGEAPSGTVVINSGATYATFITATLTLSATDSASGVAQMSFSHDGATWSTWEPFAISRTWVLASGDGDKTVHARYKDNAGNVSATVTDTITLDTVAPTAAVAALAVYQTAPAFSVSWSGSDGLSGVST